MRIYNTLTRHIEEIIPIEAGKVKMYSCGPTVYRFIHIGNLRTFTMADWIRRAFEYRGFEVFHVKNITDVGHMRQEMVDRDRKSTRLNSSHLVISYAVFCLK